MPPLNGYSKPHNKLRNNKPITGTPGPRELRELRRRRGRRRATSGWTPPTTPHTGATARTAARILFARSWIRRRRVAPILANATARRGAACADTDAASDALPLGGRAGEGATLVRVLLQSPHPLHHWSRHNGPARARVREDLLRPRRTRVLHGLSVAGPVQRGPLTPSPPSAGGSRQLSSVVLADDGASCLTSTVARAPQRLGAAACAWGGAAARRRRGLRARARRPPPRFARPLFRPDGRTRDHRR